MKLPNMLLFDQGFSTAFPKLLKQPFPSTVSLKILESLSILGTKQQNVFKIRDSLLQRFDVVLQEGGNPIFKSSENEAEFTKEINALLNDEFEIPLQDKLILTDRIILSGEDILALKPILAVNL